MTYFFRFEYPVLACFSVALVVAAIIFHRFYHVPVVFNYSLGSQLIADKKESRHFYASLFYGMRVCGFIILALLTGKPQLVDVRSNVIVEGIDIILTLDASGSMQLQDYSDDNRSRFEIAKDEATRFIQKRPDDAIGLVLFGNAALCRCPLTMDKKILTELIEQFSLGEIDPDGTLLSTALVTAINRLKRAGSQSKIIILLTDGEPSQGDIDPRIATEIAKKFGIKIYAIGIGSEEDATAFHPLYGCIIQKPKVNAPLLKEIARQTGGKFFMAHNDRDMRSIYDTIDELERTKHESPLYSRYIDIYSWLVILVLLLVLSEQLLAATVWFGL